MPRQVYRRRVYRQLRRRASEVLSEQQREGLLIMVGTPVRALSEPFEMVPRLFLLIFSGECIEKRPLSAYSTQNHSISFRNSLKRPCQSRDRAFTVILRDDTAVPARVVVRYLTPVISKTQKWTFLCEFWAVLADSRSKLKLSTRCRRW